MTLPLSDEQEEFRRSVRGLLDLHSAPEQVRAAMASERGCDDAVWRALSQQLGAPGLLIPEALGGAEFTFAELAPVLEEAGRALLCAPLFSTVVLATGALLHAGDEAAQERLLPGIASGEHTATLAWIDDGPGAKSFVLDGATADLVLVVDGDALYEAVPVSRDPLTTVDETRRQARLTFDLSGATRIDCDGRAVLDRVLRDAVVALALEQCGVAQRALEMAVEYAGQREQFGRPIGSFQAIKHRCAELLIDVERARTVAYAAASDLDDAALAATAGLLATEASLRATAENIQIHGGVGYTWEHDAHLYYKRALTSELLLGDPGARLDELAAALPI